MVEVPLTFVSLPLSVLYVGLLVTCVVMYMKISWVPYLPTISESALSRPTGGLYAGGMTILSCVLAFVTICVTVDYGLDLTIHGGFVTLFLLSGLLASALLIVQAVLKIRLETEDDVHKKSAGVAFIGLFGMIINDFILTVYDMVRAFVRGRGDTSETAELATDALTESASAVNDTTSMAIETLTTELKEPKVITRGRVLIFAMKLLIVLTGVLFIGRVQSQLQNHLLDKATMSLKPITQNLLETSRANTNSDKGGSNESSGKEETTKKLPRKVLDALSEYDDMPRIPDGMAIVNRDENIYIVSSDPEINREMSEAALEQYTVVGLALIYLGLIGYGVRISFSVH